MGKQAYRLLCEREESIPLFSRDWWLDAVVGQDRWDVVVVERGEEIAASLPFVRSKRYGLPVSVQPPLTQTLGPWVRPGAARTARLLAREKELLEGLEDQLPDFAYFSQNWHATARNWLPFFWRGYKQTTRYSYVLPELHDLDAIWAGFENNIRTDIRKAEGRYQISIRMDAELGTLVELIGKTFARQGRNMPYDRATLERVDAACRVRNAGQLFVAEDSRGAPHAAIYVVWDRERAYYLLSGGDPALRGSGATSLCLWHAIRHAAAVTKSFDFEGSMIEPIERYFRAFGAEQVPYFQVWRANARTFRLIEAAKSLRRS
jgi:hypothetical protein